MTDQPEPIADACDPACSEGHTYEGRCAQSTGNACVWPDCLSDGQQAELAAQVLAAERGEEADVGPDQRVICGCDEAPAPDDVSQSRTAPDNPAGGGDAADNPGGECGCPAEWWASGEAYHLPDCPCYGVPLYLLSARRKVDAGVRAAAETAARSIVKALGATREEFALTGQVQASGPNLEFEAENTSQVEDDELTAEEARALAEQLGFELYQAQDTVAFVEECCVIADREGLPVTTALVREWLQGPKCARQMAAEALATRNAPAAGACPGIELNPNPCTCSCEGCRYHCGAHQPVTARRTLTDLREQYAAAIREVCGEGPWEVIVQRSTDAIMAIHDDDMDATEDEMERRGRVITGLQAQLQRAQAALPDRAQAAIRAAAAQVQVRDRQLAAIGEYVRTGDDDGIRTRERVLRILGTAGGEVGP